jgi:hypothetical protein
MPSDNQIIPAKYRYDRNHGYYQTHPPQTEVVYAGWGLYKDIYGPPNYKLTNGATLNETTKEYIAMDYIEAGPLVLGSDNNIVLKAENTISLKPGFKITGDNNYFYAKAGDIAKVKEDVDNPYLEKPVQSVLEIEPETYNNPNNSELLKSSGEVSGLKSELVLQAHEVSLGPNPNNGRFFVFIQDGKVDEAKIELTDIYGNKIDFSKVLYNNRIMVDLQKNPKGVYLLYLYSGSMFTSNKIIFQ